jgi:uncharacterized protein
MKAEDSSPLLRPALVLGVSVMVGLIVGGYLLGAEVRDFKRADRYVEVKGLVERTVKSDSATWTLNFKEPGSDLGPVLSASEKDKNTVLAFLSNQGFKPAEITVGAIDVTDRTTEQYNNNEHGPRFIVNQSITVQTSDVDRVAAANAKTADLVRAGVVIASNSNNGMGSGSIVYKFNGLNALKPDMITEATRNARTAAARFAADSGSQVGAIRSANQGVFSISADNAGPSVNDEGDGNNFNAEQQADASIMKKVRVVSTVDYYLVK